MEAKLMHVFAELLGGKNSRDLKVPESGTEAAAQRLAMETLRAGSHEVSATQEEDPLGWLVGLAEQGVISRAEALMAANPELLGETMLNNSNDIGQAMGTLLKWSDEYRRTSIRIYADAPASLSRISTETASEIGSFDGYSLLHGPLSQASGRVGELCYAYLDVAESGQMIHAPDGEPDPILIPGSRASDTYKTFNQASGLPGLCEHLSRRIISLLETEYEGLFESLNGSPLTIALIEQNNAVGLGSLQDMQLEALLRAALRSVRQGGEPKLEIMVRNPADVDEFRATRDWIDGVAEQTLCGRLRCIPYRVGVLLTVDPSLVPNVSQTGNRPAARSGESANPNNMSEVGARQIKQVAQAADLARFADTVILEVIPTPSDDIRAENQLIPSGVDGHVNTSDTIKCIMEAVRRVKPELPLWVAIDEINQSLEGISIWENELTGVICPDTAVPAARLAAARLELQQPADRQHTSGTAHNHAWKFPLA
ncbi:PEP-utilizing protein [Paenibacillus peoriae]|jgi:pyruvate,orthophosphate dikinase|uniref:PEP-utilizing protein n=1 Tax=Paenibacillus TaxID=44249 RepID=UPI0006A75636|nr:PEP-utilizing protein [Paenibacillus peoriae]ALA43897.1 PEP-utilizing protein [Paenibacillus peoriae]